MSEDSNIESRAIATLNYVIDSVNISMRKAKLVDEKGLLQIKEDSLLPAHPDYNINLQKAIAIARNPVASKGNMAMKKVITPAGGKQIRILQTATPT